MSAGLSFHGYGHHHERGAEIARHHLTAIELAPTDGRMLVSARQLVSALTNGTAGVLLLEVEKSTMISRFVRQSRTAQGTTVQVRGYQRFHPET
jgi:hypothetical protein